MVALSLEERLNQLEGLVKSLENQNLTIDQAIDKYVEGMHLALACRSSLNEMSKKITCVRQEVMEELNKLEQEAQLPMQNVQANLGAIPKSQQAAQQMLEPSVQPQVQSSVQPAVQTSVQPSLSPMVDYNIQG